MNYTCRVRHIVSSSSPNGYLDQCSISATFNPPLPDPLFPNLRSLIWQGGTATLPAINFAASLPTSLDICGTRLEDVSLYISLLDTLVPRCPNIKNIRVQVSGDSNFGSTVSRHLSCWQKLRVVDLLNTAFPVDVILYLTQIPTLTWLSFTLDPHFPYPVPAPHTTLVFSRLAYLEIVSESFELATNLLAHIQLPVTQTLILPFPNRPSKAAVRSYLATIVKTCASKALIDLRLLNLWSFSNDVRLHPRTPDSDAWLTFYDLASCATFANLRGVHVNLEWPVDLTDGRARARRCVAAP